MNLYSIVFRNLSEGLSYALVVVILFNNITDFATKTGFITSVLTVMQLRYFGIAASLLGLFNALSHKFFGFPFIR